MSQQYTITKNENGETVVEVKFPWRFNTASFVIGFVVALLMVQFAVIVVKP